MRDPFEGPSARSQQLRLKISAAFLDWVADNAGRWTPKDRQEDADLIIIAIFARSVRTYQAVVRGLGEREFGEQALMLNRVLFEDMIDAHWVSLNRDLAPERLAQHDLYSRLLRADTERRFKDLFPDRMPVAAPKVSNEERQVLRRLFGRSGSKSWTGIAGLDQRVDAVRGCWGSKDDQEMLLWWAAWVHKISNEVLHPSGLSLNRLGSPEFIDEKTIAWNLGNSPELLAQALHGAFFTFGHTVGLVIREYRPEDGALLRKNMRLGETGFEEAMRWEIADIDDAQASASSGGATEG